MPEGGRIPWEYWSRPITEAGAGREYLLLPAANGPFQHSSDNRHLRTPILRRDVLYSALDRSGIARPKRVSGFHMFRHSASTFLNQQTGNLKLAQKFLGHADISTTANIYTHTSSESDRGASVAIERAIFGDLFPVVPNIENGNTNSDPE